MNNGFLLSGIRKASDGWQSKLVTKLI